MGTMTVKHAPSSGDPALADVRTRVDLARELTALRTRAGLTVRSLSRRLDMPAATVGDYFSGRHLPGITQRAAFRALLRECGAAEAELQAWMEALERVRLASDRRVGRVDAPYRGLEPFEVTDAPLFFGREATTELVLARLRELCQTPPSGGNGAVSLIVTGPSGSGKSSLLRAGVAASVRGGALGTSRAPWSSEIIVPGDSPMRTLDSCRDDLGRPPRLLIVDQLEEIFAAAPSERAEFLSTLSGWRGPGTVVVAGLRADFYEAALGEPLLLGPLAEGQVLLGPMSEDELRRAILEPARRVGATVEPSLADLLLAELAPGSPAGVAHATGVLPLLSHALLATWNRARGNALTVAEYREAGGLLGAVSRSAEKVYADLDPAERERARRLFCRLVRVSEDGPLTRRRVPRGDLDELEQPERSAAGATVAVPAAAVPAAAVPAASVLERFVAARLLTADSNTVELSHEALLAAWPRLAQWIEQDRAGVRLHHQIADATEAWAEADRDPSFLIRGPRLQSGAEWAEDPDHRAQLTRAEHEFLQVSLARVAGERRTAQTRARRMQQLLGALAVLTVAAATLAGLALRAQHSAATARDKALSREVAIEAGTLERTDPALAMQLALSGARISPTIQATSTLINASAFEMPTRVLGADGPTSEALGGHGRELALADSASDRIGLYRMTTAARPVRLATVSPDVAGQQLYAVALSPNGRLLAAGGSGRRVTLWSLATPAHPMPIASLGGFTRTVYGIAFSPDGTRLAASDADGTVRQWSLAVPHDPGADGVLAAPGHPSLQAVSYAPDGRTLTAVGAIGDSAGTLDVWRVGGDKRLLAHRTLAPSPLTTVAYSPNGGTLAVGSQDALVYVLRIGADGRLRTAHRPLRGFTNWVDSLAFSPDGRYLAAGSSDSTVRLWSAAHWIHVATLAHPAPVTGVLFSPDDHHLVTVDEDGTARVWSFPTPSSIREPGGVFSIDYSADGDRLAAVSGGAHGDVDLWDSADPWRPVHVAAVTVGRGFGAAAGVESLSPSGRLLAVGDAQGKTRLVDLSNPRRPRPIGPLLGGATPPIEQLNFSPDMRLLSVSDQSGRIHLWDIADPAHPTRLPTLDSRGSSAPVLGVAFSPNGRLLAAASADRRVRLWDVADPRDPRLLSVLGGLRGYVFTVAFTPNGRTLIAGSADDTIRLWDISDPADPRALGRPLTGATSTIYDIAVDPSGTTLAAATTGHVLLWSIRDPSHPVEIADLTAAAGSLYDVTFSPDDTTLAAGGADPTLHFWHFHPGQVAARICAVAGARITRGEWKQYIQGAAFHPPCSGTSLHGLRGQS
jgi:WD40 repeat protein/transcriptional regulator with XRE-family HTH domain